MSFSENFLYSAYYRVPENQADMKREHELEIGVICGKGLYASLR